MLYIVVLLSVCRPQTAACALTFPLLHLPQEYAPQQPALVVREPLLPQQVPANHGVALDGRHYDAAGVGVLLVVLRYVFLRPRSSLE